MSFIQRFENFNSRFIVGVDSLYLQGDLTNELYEEYQLTVLASDTGTPSLSTRAKLRLVVLQVVTLPPNTGVGFEDSSHVIQVRLLNNTLRVKEIQRNIDDIRMLTCTCTCLLPSEENFSHSKQTMNYCY